MSNLGEQLGEAFRAAGLRFTEQRYAVMEYLVKRRVHATADDILQAVNRNHPRVSRATIYNSLRSLTDAGLVREVAAEGNAARYDASLHPHHHFLCDICGRVEDVAWFEVSSPESQTALGRRTISRYEIVFHGTCESCGRESLKPE